MENTINALRRIKVDALYGKKKHFNAGDRFGGYNKGIGIPLILLNVVAGSVLFYVITDGFTNWVKYVPLWMAFVAAALTAFQTFYNPEKKAEGHRRIGNRYLAVMKRCDVVYAHALDKILTADALAALIAEIGKEIDSVNKDAEAFPTSKGDYEKAKAGIEAGEETYTDGELAI